MAIYDISGNILSGDADLESYYETEAETTIDSVRDLLTEPCMVFPLITDIHYLSDTSLAPSSFLKSIRNIKYLSQKLQFDFLMNLGDNTDAVDTSAATTVGYGDTMLEKFLDLGLPYYQAIGNHDTNYYGTTLLTLAQTYRSYLANTYGVIFDSTGTNYYKDFDEYGIRLVVLNANYLTRYAFNSATSTWLSGTALDTTNIVLLATHLSPISAQNWSNNNPTNSTAVTTAVQDFVDNGGVVVQLNGHSHCDYSFTSPWRSVFTTCNKCQQVDVTGSGYTAVTTSDDGLYAPERAAGTVTEDCWDVVVIRPTSRLINFVRFGAGSDREFSF